MARPIPSDLDPRVPSLPGVSEERQGARVRVKVTTRAHRDEIVDLEADPIRVKLVAPPVDGAANEALTQYLARLLAVPRGAVEIVSGARSRNKTVLIRGLDAKTVVERLAKASRRRSI